MSKLKESSKNNKKLSDSNVLSPTIIKVVGIGGAGCAVINRLMQTKITGVELIAVNTDNQALAITSAHRKLKIGRKLTHGLGVGGNPELGLKAAEENQSEIEQLLKNSDLVFLTCGLGGGTGTGATPFVADILKKLGILTIAIITKPFNFEGGYRSKIAEQGLQNLINKVDIAVVIHNEKLLCSIDKLTPLIHSFKIADDVLEQAVRGISEIITIPGLVNIDFADVKDIIRSGGPALMGMGKAEGDGRAIRAVKIAIENPILDVSIKGAKGVLFTVTGGSNLTLNEINEAASCITEKVHPEAKIIFGAIIDEAMGEEIRITVIATNFDDYNIDITSSAQPTTKTINIEESNSNKDYAPKKDEKTGIKPTVQINRSVKIDKETEELLSSDEELEIPTFIRLKLKK